MFSGSAGKIFFLRFQKTQVAQEGNARNIMGKFFAFMAVHKPLKMLILLKKQSFLAYIY